LENHKQKVNIKKEGVARLNILRNELQKGRTDETLKEPQKGEPTEKEVQKGGLAKKGEVTEKEVQKGGLEKREEVRNTKGQRHPKRPKKEP
jgi:hypothetical protein